MYRYSNKKYNDLLFNMGIIRIGTLYDFRNIEHKKGIADLKEGTKIAVHNGDIRIIHNGSIEDLRKNNSSYRALEEMNFIKIDGVVNNLVISNNKVSKNINSKDYFILCTSKKETSCTEFESYDSCYKINDINNFYNEITIALNRILPIKFLGYHKVIYRDRIENWEHTQERVHPSLIKELKYKEQFEIRAIWEPLDRSKPIKPLIISSYKLGRFMTNIPLI